MFSEADGTTVGDISNSGAFPLGARGAGPSYPFEGLIDEFRIYDRLLSGDEVSDYYDSNLPHHWIESNSVPIQTTFTIDGEDVASSWFVRVIRGEHTIAADQFTYHPYIGWLEFDHFIVDGGNPIYNNPMTVSISAYTTIEAHYG